MVALATDGGAEQQGVHVVDGRGGAGPKLELAAAVGDGSAGDAVLHGGDEVELHEHPCVVGVAEGIPVARVRDAVVVLFKVTAEPGVVVAAPSDGAFEVVVGVFEAFDEDAAGHGRTGNQAYQNG